MKVKFGAMKHDASEGAVTMAVLDQSGEEIGRLMTVFSGGRNLQENWTGWFLESDLENVFPHMRDRNLGHTAREAHADFRAAVADVDYMLEVDSPDLPDGKVYFRDINEAKKRANLDLERTTGGIKLYRLNERKPTLMRLVETIRDNPDVARPDMDREPLGRGH